MKRTLIGGVIAFVLSAVALSAAPPRGDTIATVDLNYPAYATTSSTSTLWPHLGDSVTFTATFPKNLEHNKVEIQVLCYQNGTLVYGQAASYTESFLLGGAMSTWFLTNGDAQCVADLFYWSYQGGQKYNFLAETQFAAYAR